MRRGRSFWRIAALALASRPWLAVAQTSSTNDFKVTYPPAGGDLVVYDVAWSQPDPATTDYDFSCAETCFINWTQSGIDQIFVKIEWSDSTSSGEYATTFNTSADNSFLSWGKLPYNSVDEWNTKARYRWMFFPQYTPDNNGPNLLAFSDYFAINIKDWSYTKGTPASSTGSTGTQGSSGTTTLTSSSGSSGGSSSYSNDTETNATGGSGSSSGSTGNGSTGTDDADSGQLSTAAKAGIAVGAIVIVLLVIGMLFFVIRRRRNSKRNSPNAPGGSSNTSQFSGKAELQGSTATSSGIPYEKAELPQSSRHGDATELDSRGFVAELPGSNVSERAALEKG